MTAESPRLFTRFRLTLATALMVLVASIYMLTYSGRIQSGDTLRFFDAITSSVRYGDFNQDETLFFSPPIRIKTISEYPLRPLDIELHETLHIRLGSLFYLLADMIPNMGYVHTVWLFNIVVTALAVAVFFLFAMAMGYDDRTAFLASLVFGLFTIVFPYTKTFFREPLLLLLLLSSAFCLWQWRVLDYPFRQTGVTYLIFGGIAFSLSLLTKTTAVFALPALLILVYPVETFSIQREKLRRISGFLIPGIIMVVAITIFASPLFEFLLSLFGPVLDTRNIETQFARDALHTYLFSLGGSFWGTSPVLLLAIPGGYWLYHEGRTHLIWSVLILVLTFAFAHAFLTGIHWFGGLSWSPRFLVPVVPFVMLLTLPVINRLLQVKSYRWLRLPVIGLLAYSLWIQWNAVALDWTQYSKFLPPEANGLGEWSPGLNQIEFLRWFVLPRLWGSLGLDFAWGRAESWIWLVLFLVLVVICLVFVILAFQKRLWLRFSTGLIVLLPLLWLGMTIVAVRSIYFTDGLYRGQQAALHEALAIVEREAEPSDFLLLPDDIYAPFIMNYSRLTIPRTISLEPQPGESPGEMQPAQVTSHNPSDLLTNTAIRSVDHLALKNDRIWLLAHNSEFIPFAVRPVERYLGMHYYLIGDRPTTTADPTVRLYEYSTVHAPDPYSFTNAETNTDFQFGGSIRLLGVTLPEGDTYALGDVVPISFQWMTDDSLSQNYKVAWFLANDGAIYQDEPDTEPYAGFASTSSWTPGVPIWDNRALRLPENAVPGVYRIWVRLYNRDNAEELLPASGIEVREDTIAVLPLTIEIESKD